MFISGKILGVSATLLFCICCVSSLAAQTIAGTVHNQTTKTPAAGDEVVLLRLGNGMEEEGRTKTDAQGAFTLAEKTANAQYVIRVLHQGVNYDQNMIGTAPLDINVFDAVPKIKGLSGSIGMAQMESDGKIVKVTEMYAITNSTTPPVTQAGPRNFEFSLPEKATFDAAQVKRAEGTIWVNIAPAPVQGQPGRYALNFPIRPGDTLFKFTYHVPYSERTRFHMKLPYPIQKFAVIHPTSISFKTLQPKAFMSPGRGNGLVIEKVVREPLVGEVPPFEISGVGVASAPSAVARAAPAPQVSALPTPASVSADNRGGGAPAATVSSAKTLWILLAVVSGIVAVAAFAAWKRGRAPQSKQAGGEQPLVEALKEELFQLELDRAQGSISAEDYAASKQALSQSLQRAIGKAAAGL